MYFFISYVKVIVHILQCALLTDTTKFYQNQLALSLFLVIFMMTTNDFNLSLKCMYN